MENNNIPPPLNSEENKVGNNILKYSLDNLNIKSDSSSFCLLNQSNDESNDNNNDKNKDSINSQKNIKSKNVNKDNINKICNNISLKIINKKENEYKTRIGISLERLKNLDKEELIDLIIYIDYTCNLTLEDKNYLDYTYKNFKTIKNTGKNCYDIIIDKNNKYNIEKQNKIHFQENGLEKEDDNNNDEKDNIIIFKRDNVKFENNKEDKNKKIKKDYNNKKEDEKVEHNPIEKKKKKAKYKIHPINLPIYCSIHDNKFENIKKYLIHCEKTHSEFKCFYCGKKCENHTKLKKHLYMMNSIYNKKDKVKDNINNNSCIKEFNRNISKNNEKEKIKCLECDKIFQSTDIMIGHFYEVHDKNLKDESIKKKIENKINQLLQKKIQKENITKKNKEYKIDSENERDNTDEVIQDILKSNMPKKNKKNRKYEKEKSEESEEIEESEENDEGDESEGSEESDERDDIDDINDYIFDDEEKKNNTNKEGIKVGKSHGKILKKKINAYEEKEQNSKINNNSEREFICCKVCNKFFNSKEAKEQHCKIKNHVEKYCCKICNKYFNSQDAKLQHCSVKKHTDEFCCKVCNKFFNSLESKEQHCKVKNHF